MSGAGAPITPFLGVAAPPGTRSCVRVPIAEFADGAPVTLPVAVLAGTRPGPTLYVQAGIHGDELTGIDIAWRLIQDVEPARLAGTLVVVPIANPPSYLSRSRGFLQEERILQDANRLFPGNTGGLLTERIAAVLFASFVKCADFTLDLHSPLEGTEMVTFVHVGSDADDDGWLTARMQHASAFGAPYLYFRRRGTSIGSSDMSRSLASQAELARKAVIMVELGTSRQICRAASDDGLRGVRRILASMGMLSEKADLPVPASRRFSSIRPVHANRGGGLRMNVALGTETDKGEVLGTVVDAFGAPVETLRSPGPGFVMRLMTLGSIATGAEVAWIAN